MYTLVTAKEIIQKALDVSYKYYPADSIWQPIVSTRNQLNYLLEAVEHKNDRSRLDEIILGIYAVREFEQAHDDFANVIYEVCEILNQLKKNRL